LAPAGPPGASRLRTRPDPRGFSATEWLANITNLKTRRAYKEDVREFIAFTGLQDYMRVKLRPAKLGIHVNIQQTAATENQRPDKDDQPQVKRFHQPRDDWKYQELWEPDQHHGLAGLFGAVLLDLLSSARCFTSG
jgi:hypothetical protein